MTPRFRAVVVFLFFVALATRLLCISLSAPRLSPDSSEYLTLATNIRAHGSFSLSPRAPYTPTIRRPPGYPLFLALFGASLNATRMAQSLLDALVSAMICAVAARRVRLRWAAAAGLIYAVHPGAIFYANTILSETPFTFLLSSAIALLVVAIHRDGLGWAGVAGIVMALAALCRPIGAPLIVVAAGVLLLSATQVPRRFRMAGVFCAAALLTLAPWLIRSGVLAGRFVLVSSTGPVNFALATVSGQWNLNDQASIFQSDYFSRVDPCGRSVSRARSPRESAAADDICLEEAMSNLRRNPGYYARSRLSQLIHFPLTSFDFVTGNQSTFGTAIAQRQYRALALKLFLYALFSFAPLLLAFAGTLLAWRFIEDRLAAAVWTFTIAIYAPGFVEYRYFLPAVPMVLVCAAFGIDQLRRPRAAAADSGG
jgi:4-amino-4-deoxy-L-arabinose transferase-like glycosyltransferase